jgi:hypothetical protein
MRALSQLPATLAMAALLLVSGCSRDSITTPAPSVSGPVVLVGYLTDAAGHFTGTRVFADAEGIPVELVSDRGVVATTTTVHGRYTFTGIPHGSYKVRTQVTYDLVAETRMVTVTDAALMVADTLRLNSRGDLFPYPNPFSASVFTTFLLPSSTAGSLRVLDRSGHVVRTLLQGVFPGGTNGVPWNGNDASNTPVPAGFYWLSFDDGVATRTQLLFRQ